MAILIQALLIKMQVVICYVYTYVLHFVMHTQYARHLSLVLCLPTRVMT